MTLPDQDNRARPAAKRKPWVYEPTKKPGVAALFAGAEARRAFFRYWISDNIWNAFHLIGHYGLRLLPMDACSNVGALFGPFAVRRFHPVAERRARATIAKLRPDLSQDQQEALFIENCRNQGRLISEFSVINRLLKHEDRVEVHHLDWVEEAARRGPVILVGMHLGNWEVAHVIHARTGLRSYVSYTPPPGRAKAWIANRVRRKHRLDFLPPGVEGIRPTVKALKGGGLLSMFCDEGFDGRIRGPLFGRPPNLEGNLALAVRLARMTGATICPWYNLRRQGFRFVAIGLPPIMLPPEDKPGARLVDDILLLNSVIEPVVLEHLDQWYFLDNELAGGGKADPH